MNRNTEQDVVPKPEFVRAEHLNRIMEYARNRHNDYMHKLAAYLKSCALKGDGETTIHFTNVHLDENAPPLDANADFCFIVPCVPTIKGAVSEELTKAGYVVQNVSYNAMHILWAEEGCDVEDCDEEEAQPL